MWPCSPHLKHVSPFLRSVGFDGLLVCSPLWPVGLVVVLWLNVFELMFVALFRLHGSLRPAVSVALVVNWSAGDKVAPCSIESFSGGSSCSPLSDVIA